MTQKICFIVCPIGEDGSETRKRSDTVLKHFLRPVCEDNGYTVVRVDELVTVDRIDSTITKYLEEAELVIADLTELNPNAFYEFGYRQALNLPLIPIIQENHVIPFDVKTLRTIHYVTDDLDKVEAIKIRLSDTIKTFDTYSHDVSKSEQNLSMIEATSIMNIHDKLDNIIELLKIKNDETVDLISAQVAKYAQPPQSMDTAIMQTLMPMLLSDPDKVQNLMKFAENFKKND